MKNQNLYKKGDLFKDEEEPIPEKYTTPINSPKKRERWWQPPSSSDQPVI